jgi:hypothetical protein
VPVRFIRVGAAARDRGRRGSRGWCTSAPPASHRSDCGISAISAFLRLRDRTALRFPVGVFFLETLRGEFVGRFQIGHGLISYRLRRVRQSLLLTFDLLTSTGRGVCSRAIREEREVSKADLLQGTLEFADPENPDPRGPHHG